MPLKYVKIIAYLNIMVPGHLDINIGQKTTWSWLHLIGEKIFSELKT
jgi:hypothetical protein